jgi:hypothetical protein
MILSFVGPEGRPMTEHVAIADCRHRKTTILVR